MKNELEAIAPEELRGPLYFADNLREASPEDRERLRSYLVAELEEGGMLSLAKAKECEMSLGQVRVQARRLLTTLDSI